METIFDHNVTEKELRDIFDLDVKTKEEYLSLISTNIEGFIEPYDQDDCYVTIALLYNKRGDKKKADEYIEKIEDKMFKTFTLENDDLAIWRRGGQ